MDEKNLQRLRERYGQSSGGVLFDPKFKAVAEQQFSNGDRRKWPFADVATFLSAPYRQDFEGLDFALIGIPMDLGVTNRAGARFGPRAVRAVEDIGPYEHVLQRCPLSLACFADVGDIPMQSRYNLEQCHADIEAFMTRIVAAGVVPLSVGGDHSLTFPILKALGKAQPVGLLHIDAHCDTSGVYEGTKFHHGGPFRQAVLEGVLDPHRTVQIGIRGASEYLWEFSYDSGMSVIHAEEVDSLGLPAIIAKARAVIGSGPVYISFDIDSLDPGFAPGTGTPEVGGLTPREVLAILRSCDGLDVIGADVVEIAPAYDSNSTTARYGAQILFTLAALAVEAKRRRGLV